MSVAQRIIEVSNQIIRNSEYERLQREQLNRQRTNDAQDLRDRNVLHEMDDANKALHEQNVQLRRENDALRQRLAQLEQQAQDVLRQVADRSEAWRRTAEHLRTTWGPLLPDVRSDDEAVGDIADAKGIEAQDDEAWQQKRDVYISECLAPAVPAKKA